MWFVLEREYLYKYSCFLLCESHRQTEKLRQKHSVSFPPHLFPSASLYVPLIVPQRWNWRTFGFYSFHCGFGSSQHAPFLCCLNAVLFSVLVLLFWKVSPVEYCCYTLNRGSISAALGTILYPDATIQKLLMYFQYHSFRLVNECIYSPLVVLLECISRWTKLDALMRSLLDPTDLQSFVTLFRDLQSRHDLTVSPVCSLTVPLMSDATFP